MSASDFLCFVVESRTIQGDQVGEWVHETTVHVSGEDGLELARKYVTGRQSGGRILPYTRQFRILTIAVVEMT